jgi:beta-lactamase regulating signal transducer with metallopeptidase domain
LKSSRTPEERPVILSEPRTVLRPLLEWLSYLSFHAFHAFGELLVFSVLFMMLFLLAAGLRAAFGGAARKHGALFFPALAAATIALRYTPVGSAAQFLLNRMVSFQFRLFDAWFGQTWVEYYLPAIAVLYSAGVFFSIVLLALRCLRLRRELSRMPDYPDADAIAKARAGAGLRRAVRVKAAGAARQVASWGILRAWILVPDDFAEHFNPEERHWIYLHELTHFQRRDPLRYMALALWRAVFWFDPVCRRAANDIRHGFELACDRAVVGLYGADPLEYSRLIVKTAALERGMPIGFSSGFGNMGRRIGRLLGKEEAENRRRILCGALVAAAMIAAFVHCCAARPDGRWFAEYYPSVTAGEDGTVLFSASSPASVIIGKDGIMRELRHDYGGELRTFGTRVRWEEFEEIGRRDLRGPDAHKAVFI